LDDTNGIAVTLRNFAVVAHHQHDYVRARSMFEESLALHRQLDDRSGIQMSLLYFGDLARDLAAYGEAITAYGEGRALAEQRGDTHGIAYSLRGLGHIARAQGLYARARELLRESLTLLRDLRDRRCIPLCLEGLACLAVGSDWAERAARLFGAAHATQESTGAPAPPADMADYQRTETDARAHLGDERFNDLWAAGAAMSLDEAVAYALAADEPASTVDGLAPDRRAAGAPREAHRLEHSVSGPPMVPFSRREREVVALIAEGLSNRQIAERLILSVRTVERHIENVYNRLGISGKAGRAIITAYALRHDLIGNT
jgi:DNA-binding CsgD family transcriptional regulator